MISSFIVSTGVQWALLNQLNRDNTMVNQMEFQTIDLEEFNAMIYQAVVNGLTFSAEAAGEMHRRIYIITYTGGY